MQYADTDLYELKMKDLATIEEFQKRLRQSEATASDDRTQGGKNDVALRAANEGAGDRCPRAQCGRRQPTPVGPCGQRRRQPDRG